MEYFGKHRNPADRPHSRVVCLPATPPLPTLEPPQAPAPHWNDRKWSFWGCCGCTVKRGLHDEIPGAPTSMGLWCPGAPGTACPAPAAGNKLQGGSAGCVAGPQPSLRQRCCWGTARVPGAGAGPSAQASLASGMSAAGGAPGGLAAGGSSCGGAGLASRQGRAASGGGHPRGPGPASTRESRLRVINSFPGSRAGAAARAGSQPAQHPGRLPRLSSPTSFAPSSGDEPSWSLQALTVKPRGAGRLSRPARVPCGPQSISSLGTECREHAQPHCGAVTPTKNGGLRAPAPVWLQDNIAALQPRLFLRPAACPSTRWAGGANFSLCRFWGEAEQEEPRAGGAPSLQSEPSGECWLLEWSQAPGFQLCPRWKQRAGPLGYSHSSLSGA